MDRPRYRPTPEYKRAAKRFVSFVLDDAIAREDHEPSPRRNRAWLEEARAAEALVRKRIKEMWE